jgi:polyphosphate kinase
LGQVRYEAVQHEKVVLPPRVHNPEYHRGPIPAEMYVPAIF